jgi:hypothetical protein
MSIVAYLAPALIVVTLLGGDCGGEDGDEEGSETHVVDLLVDVDVSEW